MWSRFIFLPLWCLAVVSCFSQNDRGVDQIKNSESRVPLTSESNNKRDGPIGFDTVDSTRGNERRGTSDFGHHENQGSDFHKFNNEGSSIVRPAEGFGQSSSNQENYQHSTGSRPNNQEHFSGRPTGQSTHNSNHKEDVNRPSGSRPSSGGENPFGQPTGGLSHITDNGESRPSGSRPSIIGENLSGRPTGGSGHITDNINGENRPSGSRPTSVGENSFGRPTGGSAHITDNINGENRPTGSRPAGVGEDSFGRPTGGSGHITDNINGENRPSRSRPTSVGENSFGRPTGGSAHITDNINGENRPTGSRPAGVGEDSFGRPTGGSSHITDHINGENLASGSRPTGESGHNQQSGFRPENQEHSFGGTTQRPDSHQESGHSTTDQNESNKQTDNKEQEKDDKEEEKDVCFTHLGCFKMGKPWRSVLRPIGAPFGPEKIQTTIHFYSRSNLEKPKYITMFPQINMGEARFDPNKITAMIVHGFSNSGNATWLKDMKNVYLKKVDANVMIVDWGKGAQLLNYLQVAGNTRVVGKQLGVFVKYLIDNFRADPGKFHLIGHSLGAQICSYLGKEVQGFARLTALDPAQPAFEGFDMEVRLDKNDAEFVDVLHTDARPFIPTLGFGMITPHGHVDFYMNGGFDQPGCVPPSKKELPSVNNILDLAKYPVEVIAKTVACPHSRAYEYLIESFNETENCIFWGHKADVKNVFKSVTNTVTQGLLKKFTALSTTCSKEDCIPVGFATKKSPLRGVFVVTTNGRPPYCISEPGVPPETPPQERKQESFIQKIKKRVRMVN